MTYANIGLDAISGPGEEPSTGWTPPTLIWGRMKDIDLAVDRLDQAIKANVKRAAFLTNWEAWRKRWKDLVDRYESWGQRLAAATYSDELAAQVESERKVLLQFEDAYKREGGDAGALPNVPGGMPADPRPPPPPPQGTGLSVPWWVWVIGIGAVAGLGAFVYYRIKATRVDPRLAEMTSRYGLPSTQQIDAARLEATRTAGNYLSAGRDTPEQYGTVLGGMRMCSCPNQIVTPEQ